MKKITTITLTLASVLVLTVLLTCPIYGQDVQKAGNDKNQMPQEVLKITKKSCANCHYVPATGFSISLLNFSKFEKLSDKKKASFASSVCKMVSKGKMPPKSFLEKHPDAALTADEIKTLCDWAESLKVVKK